ncbi:MAG: energy transducer TonB [Terriglobales bacterium]
MNTQKNIPKCGHSFAGLERNAAIALFTLLLLPLRFAGAASGLDKQIKFDYLEKVLTLRHFYGGEHLEFHSNGRLIGDAPIGPWTLDGQIEVEDVHLHGTRLVIKGRRIHLIFSQNKPQDQLALIKNDQGKQQKELAKALERLKVAIEIELPSDNPDEKDVSAAIQAVFLTGSESMMDVVPAYWQAYFAKQEGKPQTAPSANGPVYSLKPGSGMSPPRAIRQPDPEYSEEARKAKFQGTEIISLIVDPSGMARDMQIQRPLGLGLDEKAIAAISTWKFEPAQKDGTPVAVAIMVEVTFHLY